MLFKAQFSIFRFPFFQKRSFVSIIWLKRWLTCHHRNIFFDGMTFGRWFVACKRRAIFPGTVARPLTLPQANTRRYTQATSFDNHQHLVRWTRKFNYGWHTEILPDQFFILLREQNIPPPGLSNIAHLPVSFKIFLSEFFALCDNWIMYRLNIQANWNISRSRALGKGLASLDRYMITSGQQ